MDNGLDMVPNPAESEDDTPEIVQEEAKFSRGLYLREEENEWNRREKQRDKMFSLRMLALGVASYLILGLCIISIVIVGYLIFLWLVQTTTPWGWLSPEQQDGLANVYSSVARVVLPVSVIINAWAVWWASRQRDKPTSPGPGNRKI